MHFAVSLISGIKTFQLNFIHQLFLDTLKLHTSAICTESVTVQYSFPSAFCFILMVLLSLCPPTPFPSSSHCFCCFPAFFFRIRKAKFLTFLHVQNMCLTLKAWPAWVVSSIVASVVVSGSAYKLV